MWTLICVFKLLISVTNFVHSLQGCSFLPVCTFPKCLFKKYLVWNPLHSNYSMISCWSGFLNVYWNEQFVRILLDICYNYMASRLYEFTDVLLYFESLRTLITRNNLYKLITREWIIQGWPITSMDSWITIKIILLWESIWTLVVFI